MVKLGIELTDETLIRMLPRKTEILREEIRRLLDLAVIQVRQSDFTSPIIFVEVLGKDPPCVNYRRLNVKTRTEFFPFPNIEKVVGKVSSATTITIMDTVSRYY